MAPPIYKTSDHAIIPGQFVRLQTKQSVDATIAKKSKPLQSGGEKPKTNVPSPKKNKPKQAKTGSDAGISAGKAKYLEKKAKQLQAKATKNGPTKKQKNGPKSAKTNGTKPPTQNGSPKKRKPEAAIHSEPAAKKARVVEVVEKVAAEQPAIVSKTAKRRAARSQGKRQQARAAAAAVTGGEVTKKAPKGPAHLFAPGDEMPVEKSAKPKKVTPKDAATDEVELATDVLSFRDKLMVKFEKLKAGKSTKSSPDSDIELSAEEDDFSDDDEGDDEDVKSDESVEDDRPAVAKESSFRDKLIGNLKGSRFRFLNEILYSKDGSGGVQLFKEDKGAFKAYHEGYRQQVQQWPLNPLDRIIKAIKKM